MSEIFFPVGKVAKMVGVAGHTIRFWQQNFPQIKYKIGKGNRKYYDQKNVDLFLHIKQLMYEKGMKISGIQKIMLNEYASEKIEYKLEIEYHDTPVAQSSLFQWQDLVDFSSEQNKEKEDTIIDNIFDDIKTLKSLLNKIK